MTARRKMPAQRPHRSVQEYATPKEFLDAVREKFHIPFFDFDLAANKQNHVARRWFGPGGVEESAFLRTAEEQWPTHGHVWCNPPFGEILPFVWMIHDAAPCAERFTYLLTPASVGAGWFQKFIFSQARVYFLSPRMSFDGKGPYPKDCILSVFGIGVEPGFECWRWKP